jgi:putative transcriptional regulator
MSRFGEELIGSLEQAVAIARGKPGANSRRTEVVVPDVRRIRRSLKLSQQQFATTYRIPLATLKNWEQGRRQPDAPAAALLLAIARSPQALKAALEAV